jgi:UDP-N-acetylmuramoylalanine--D-glutamate ligase
MVLSPGVPNNSEIVKTAIERKIRIVSELDVASWYCPSPIVAVTGTNGKTTTTRLIGRIFEDAKRDCFVAGNIRPAFSSVVEKMNEKSIAVLEVSSFQLDWIERFRPAVAVILNITPDHLDRYENVMGKYVISKARIFENQRDKDVLIFNVDDEWTEKTITSAKCRKIGFSLKETLAEGAFIEEGTLITKLNGLKKEIIPIKEISIKGPHNLMNAMASALVAQVLGIGVAEIRATLRNFKGVEHRLEFVREVNGVKYINDSKATNVDSVWYALQSFDCPLVLILGGRDKGNDYSRLFELVKKNVRAVVAIGESAEKVEKAFRPFVPIRRAVSIEEAINSARQLAQFGDSVLLSPACASFDWFKNYEHRGNMFKEIVNKLD